MSENELLNKVIATNSAAADSKGGFLEPAQARRFLDYVYDATVLGGQVRVERIRENTAELTRIGVGERLLRVATEAVDDGMNIGVAFTKINVSTVKYRMDWELSTEALEDGIEGAAFEDHIARMLATQVGNDLEDYAINADSALTGDPGLVGFDGWSKRGRRTGHVVDAGGNSASRDIFHKALKALPRKHRQDRGNLKFFTSPNILQDLTYAENQVLETIDPMAAVGQPAVIMGGQGFASRIYGLAVQEVPMFREDKTGDYSGAGAATASHGEVWLTNPRNLIWAVKREVQIYRNFVAKKDAIEYVLYCRVGTAVENGDAFVVVKNVKIAE